MRKACEAAAAANVKEVAFTEHVDYFYPNSDLIWEFDYREYSDTVEQMREVFQPDLIIRKSVEIGIHPTANERSKAFTDKHDFDFIIGSVHIVDDLDLHNGDILRESR